MKFSILAMVVGMMMAGSLAQAQAQDLACLYSQPNYQGGRFCFYPGQRPDNLDAFPMNDGQYSTGYYGSILIDGNAVATIYDNTDFQSSYMQPMYVDHSIPDLSQVWNNTIYSMDVESR